MKERKQVEFTGRSPWGAVQHATQYAPGIVFVSTASHGGFWLSLARWAELKRTFPSFAPFNGNFDWLEEDCDAALVPLLWPAESEPQEIFNAVNAVRYNARPHGAEAPNPGWLEVLAWLERGAGRIVKEIADRFSSEVSNLWERGSCSSGPGEPGWRVWLTRRGESRQIVFRDYPEKQFYTEEELEALKVPAAYKLGQVASVRLAPVAVHFNEGDCSGAFDGSRVISDADPGL